MSGTCESCSDLLMNIPEPTSGNSRTGPARKRAIPRALRHFFLWGWVRYHGHLIEQEPHLAAFFPKETVAAVKAVLGPRRKWWYAHPAGQHGRPSLHVATGGQPNSSSTSSTQASQRREASNTQPRGASAHLDLPDAQRHEGGEPARPRHPRVRCMELPHLFAAQRERARQSLVDSHAGLEVTDANSRAPSSRSTTLDGGRNSGAVSPEGLSTN